MKLCLKSLAGICAVFLISGTAHAGPEAFQTGPVFEAYGKTASVDTTAPLPKRLKLRVSFDAAKAATPGEVNRNFDSLARFINMHVAAGVSLKKIDVAMVVHGGSSHDLTRNSYYSAKHEGSENATADLIKALTDKGVKFYLCGQSAAYHDITKADLLPGVDMALSAMTAHAILQQNGYTLNPF